jgi:surfactin synthase thioesterase subunit
VPSTVLACLPFAGAGASFFRPWSGRALDGLDVVALQLPGRERRVAEEPYRDVGAAVDGVLLQLREQCAGAGAVVLFGHSLGAVLAYELARRLAGPGSAGPRLLRLVVSGSPAPSAPRTYRATGLPDHEFLRRVEEFAGYSHDALADPEMRELILPTLRADVEMHEGYRSAAAAPLPVPVTAVRGRTDALVTAAQIEGWREVTAAGFRAVELEGGHMYLADRSAELLAEVGRDLAGDLVAVPAA